MKAFRWALGLLLAATSLAAVLAPESTDDLVAPTQRNAIARQSPVPGRTLPVDVLTIRPRGADDGTASAFGALPRPPQAMPAAAAISKPETTLPTPQIPALPFRALGRYVDAGEETVFLQHADQNIAARVGDVLLNDYKVESLSAGVLTLIYLPLNQRQTLDIGETP